MSWVVWLALAGIVIAVVAVVGLQPKGARPVAKTGLMRAARVVLLVLAVIFAYLAFKSRSAG